MTIHSSPPTSIHMPFIKKRVAGIKSTGDFMTYGEMRKSPSLLDLTAKASSAPTLYTGMPHGPSCFPQPIRLKIKEITPQLPRYFLESMANQQYFKDTQACITPLTLNTPNEMRIVIGDS